MSRVCNIKNGATYWLVPIKLYEQTTITTGSIVLKNENKYWVVTNTKFFELYHYSKNNLALRMETHIECYLSLWTEPPQLCGLWSWEWRHILSGDLPKSLSKATTATGSVALRIEPNIIPMFQSHSYVNKYLARRQVNSEAMAVMETIYNIWVHACTGLNLIIMLS